MFWLDLEFRAAATFEDADSYLRAIWLECCGHLSGFYRGRPFASPEVAMKTTISRAFGTSSELGYVYDMGTSTELTFKLIDKASSVPVTKHPIALLARNQPPDARCVDCDEQASWLCQECQQEHESPGLLCDKHGEDHPCEDYGDLHQIFNSPRVGACGYEGPAEPPY